MIVDDHIYHMQGTGPGTTEGCGRHARDCWCGDGAAVWGDRQCTCPPEPSGLPPSRERILEVLLDAVEKYGYLIGAGIIAVDGWRVQIRRGGRQGEGWHGTTFDILGRLD